MTMLWLLFLRLNGRLAELATRDALTGVYNRNGLDQALQQHFARRDAPPLTLLLAQRLRGSVSRLQVTAADGSRRVACTVSVGVSSGFSSYAEWETAASQADQALYQVKTRGRDGVQPFVAVPAA